MWAEPVVKAVVMICVAPGAPPENRAAALRVVGALARERANRRALWADRDVRAALVAGARDEGATPCDRLRPLVPLATLALADAARRFRAFFREVLGKRSPFF